VANSKLEKKKVEIHEVKRTPTPPDALEGKVVKSGDADLNLKSEEGLGGRGEKRIGQKHKDGGSKRGLEVGSESGRGRIKPGSHKKVTPQVRSGMGYEAGRTKKSKEGGNKKIDEGGGGGSGEGIAREDLSKEGTKQVGCGGKTFKSKS